MLDGCNQGSSVITGQNWAGAGQEEDEQRHRKKLKMVDMIKQQRSSIGLSRTIPYAVFSQSSSDCERSWNNLRFQELLQQNHGQVVNMIKEEEILSTNSAQEHANFEEESTNLKIFFPSNKQAKKTERPQKEEASGYDDLLSLRPPTTSTVHSDITSTSSRESSARKNGPIYSAAAPEAANFMLSRSRPLGLDLLNLLLKCAQAVSRNDIPVATDLLAELKQGTSIDGDSMQRLAAHFSQGLARRILLHMNPSKPQSEALQSLLDTRCRAHPDPEEELNAFTALYTVSPFFKLAHFTANQAIVEAVEGHTAIHIVDLDIGLGFQWPSFIQALASRPTGPPKLLRLTGVGTNMVSLGETGSRLASFAAMFAVPFQFHAVTVGHLDEVNLLEHIHLKQGEAVAVNAVFQLHRLLNRPAETLRLERFLRSLKRIRPVAVTVVEQEAAHNTPSFISRFMEALHYYAAVFDSLDASLPPRNEERLRIEVLMFSRQIRDIVSFEGEDRVERHEKMGFWSDKMNQCGFVQIPMSSHSVSQAKLLLQLCPCDGYRLVETPSDAWPVGSISLGWQDRLLLTASTWA